MLPSTEAPGGNVSLPASGKALQLFVFVHNEPGTKHAELRERFGTDASALFAGHSMHLDALSTRKGLGIVKKCADVLGGHVNIRFEEDEVVATLECSFSVLHASLRLPTSTLIASVGDSALICRMDRAQIEQMDIDKESATHMRGATADEILTFPDYVARMERRPALVLLDENLDDPVLKTPLTKGTQLIPRLRELGYDGKIVIKSANLKPDDSASYEACGADGVITKCLDACQTNRQLCRDSLWRA